MHLTFSHVCNFKTAISYVCILTSGQTSCPEKLSRIATGKMSCTMLSKVKRKPSEILIGDTLDVGTMTDPSISFQLTFISWIMSLYCSVSVKANIRVLYIFNFHVEF